MYKGYGYGTDLYINYDWDWDIGNPKFDDSIINSPVEFYKNDLYVRVAYYNYETGDDLTREELIEAYRAFLKGDVSGEEKLQKFHLFRTQDVYQVAERKIEDESVFRYEVVETLKKLNGEDMELDDASKEQLAEAVEDVVSRQVTWHSKRQEIDISEKEGIFNIANR